MMDTACTAGDASASNFGWNSAFHWISLERKMVRIVGLGGPCVQRTSFPCELEAIDAHKEGGIKRGNHVTNSASEVACIDVNVVDPVVPISLLTCGEEPARDGVPLLNDIVVVAVVK